MDSHGSGRESQLGGESDSDLAAGSTTSSRKVLGRFLITEYNNLAQAHFKTVDTISEFFKHYLTVISIPTAAVAIALNVVGGVGTALSTANATALFALLATIALVGFGLLWYVINLRMDALLYARAINGIRKFFYDQDDVTPASNKVLMRALPQSPQIPNYREFRYFGSVVTVFAVMNSFYLLLGMGALGVALGWVQEGEPAAQSLREWRVWAASGAFLVSHLLLYWRLARYRETTYLKSNIVGVDIDGVLNSHREHFAELLKARVGKVIDPNNITAIPARKVPDLGVSREDEVRVFNTPAYWTEMPAMPQAAVTLSRLRTAFNLRVHAFTSRPWPSLRLSDPASRASIKREWAEATTIWFAPRSTGLGKFHEALEYVRVALMATLWRVVPEPLGGALAMLKCDPMSIITIRWLRRNGFSCNRVVIERAGEDLSDPRANVNNRFHEAREKQIRFFVEDDQDKARKLAYVCDVVFLVDHPYNRAVDLPGNVIRVTSWDDIYDRIKELV